jgi:catechol 2,3-dioxygenase-like lactoylglutathione lyase family enzyme
MKIARLDHLVLTVADVAKTCDFYTTVLGMDVVQFGKGRIALRFGQQKINLHPADNIPGLVADKPTCGSGDLCFITETPIAEIVVHLRPRPARRRDRHHHLGLYPRPGPKPGRDFELLIDLHSEATGAGFLARRRQPNYWNSSDRHRLRFPFALGLLDRRGSRGTRRVAAFWRRAALSTFPSV